jgi:hypothetical protein
MFETSEPAFENDPLEGLQVFGKIVLGNMLPNGCFFLGSEFSPVLLKRSLPAVKKLFACFAPVEHRFEENPFAIRAENAANSRCKGGFGFAVQVVKREVDKNNVPQAGDCVDILLKILVHNLRRATEGTRIAGSDGKRGLGEIYRGIVAHVGATKRPSRTGRVPTGEIEQRKGRASRLEQVVQESKERAMRHIVPLQRPGDKAPVAPQISTVPHGAEIRGQEPFRQLSRHETSGKLSSSNGILLDSRQPLISGAGQCPERDSNPQGLLHQILSLARLPIPPPGLALTYRLAIEQTPLQHNAKQFHHSRHAKIRPDTRRSTLDLLRNGRLLPQGPLFVMFAAKVNFRDNQRSPLAF